ncbi:SAM-dependent methyltransferase [Niveibacterium umoris]|uniref:SAM-dependent MidA family methyltransferase n=1 Tax=Niveibacterium umoris TaxID=1193620 RepID=A0A840BTS4_9RHOO|nr:SAM-dependent methyltransferase [Niveibacterium umoris]MBB4013757.1 SAM-dependent MidA family methyltransferase [Niveibacterium umoris]
MTAERPDQLPPPSPDALAASQALTDKIRAAIDDAGGWIPFSGYMALALYSPGLGYYSGGARKFGPGGDFITAPELTPLFGQALAAQLSDLLQQTAPVVLEVGAGTGLLAADLLAALALAGHLPEHYQILELSGELRARQQETLQQKVPTLASRVKWIDTLPEAFDGVVVANEVLDVMPVELAVWRDGGIYQRGVTWQGRLCWADRPASGELLTAAMALPAPMSERGEYVSEICLASRAWIREWSRRLSRGALLLVDYGYPRHEYYLPSRSTGTLICYYRHRAHPDPFLWPGLTDITSFVDFTAVAETAFDAGLDVHGYIDQGAFLLNCGLLERLAERGPTEHADYIRAARAAQRLIAPHEMGELFKVLALGHGIAGPLRGFVRGDRLHTL